MDDDQIMQQEAPGGETDDFLDGWDETDAAEASEEDEDPTPAGDAETPAEAPESAPGGGRVSGDAPADRNRIRSDVQAFAAAFPEAARDFRSIPPEVWAAVNSGASLTAAYARYSGAREAARLQAQESARRRQRQNAWNAAASTGSMKSAGSPQRKDPFLEGWDEG